MSKSYDEYDWDKDERWQAYASMSIDLPDITSAASKVALDRIRRKWYTRTIDPSFDPTPPPSSDPSPEENLSSSSSNYNPSYNANTSANTNTSTNTNTGANANANTNANTNTNTSGNTNRNNGRSSVGENRAAEIARKVWAGLNGICVLAIVNSILPLLMGAQGAYEIALWSGFGAYMINYWLIKGKPQWNMQWWRSATMPTNPAASDLHFAMLCIIFLGHPYPLLPVQIMLGGSMLLSLAYLAQTTGFVSYFDRLPGWLGSLLYRGVGKLISSQEQIIVYVSTLTLVLVPLLLFQIFTGSCSFFTFVMYFVFVIQRYSSSFHIQQLVRLIDSKLLSWCPPMISPYYFSLRNLLSRLV